MFIRHFPFNSMNCFAMYFQKQLNAPKKDTCAPRFRIKTCLPYKFLSSCQNPLTQEDV